MPSLIVFLFSRPPFCSHSRTRHARPCSRATVCLTRTLQRTSSSGPRGTKQASRVCSTPRSIVLPHGRNHVHQHCHDEFHDHNHSVHYERQLCHVDRDHHLCLYMAATMVALLVPTTRSLGGRGQAHAQDSHLSDHVPSSARCLITDRLCPVAVRFATSIMQNGIRSNIPFQGVSYFFLTVNFF